MKHILVIGDSHSQALGPRLEALLAPDAVYVLDYPGYSTQRVLDAAQRGGIDPVDLAIVILGGNDFGDRGSERERFVQFLRNSGVQKILWVGPAYSTDREVNDRHADQMDAQYLQFHGSDVTWLSSYVATQTGHGPDGVHFTKAGYDRWAARIAQEAKHMLHSAWPMIGWGALLAVAGTILYKTLQLGR